MLCDFCGKTQFEVWRLIAGPGVYICDECVEICRVMLAEERRKNVFRVVREDFDW